MADDIERVARAIFDSLYGDVHKTSWDFGQGPVNLSEELKERYRVMATAAIAAHKAALAEAGDVVVPREPTGKMKMAGAKLKAARYVFGLVKPRSEEIYKAMVKAAGGDTDG